jgi:hypothetical protein
MAGPSDAETFALTETPKTLIKVRKAVPGGRLF